jgi:hypothetical protein
LLVLLVAQSVLSSLEPLAKTFDKSDIFLSLIASYLASFKLGLQHVGTFFGAAECI